MSGPVPHGCASFCLLGARFLGICTSIANTTSSPHVTRCHCCESMAAVARTDRIIESSCRDASLSATLPTLLRAIRPSTQVSRKGPTSTSARFQGHGVEVASPGLLGFLEGLIKYFVARHFLHLQRPARCSTCSAPPLLERFPHNPNAPSAVSPMRQFIWPIHK